MGKSRKPQSQTSSVSPAKSGGEGASVCAFITPRANADAVEGIQLADGVREVKIRVRAIPDEGKANKAACAVLAAFLGVPKSSVRVVSGTTSRHKRFLIEGMSQDEVDVALSVLE